MRLSLPQSHLRSQVGMHTGMLSVVWSRLLSAYE